MSSPGTHRFLRWALSISILIVILTSGLSIGAVSAATTPQASINLVSQTDWNTGTNPFDLEVHVASSLDASQTELVITVFNQVRNRSQFQLSMQNKMSGNSFIIERHTLSDIIQPDSDATVSLPVQDPAQKQYFIRDPGIYPVRVELRTADSGTVLSHFVTHLIYEPPLQAPAQPLGVTSILPIQAAQSNNSKTPLSTPDNGASFETISKTLAAHPKTAATLLAEPESVERLSNTGSPIDEHVLSDFKSSLNGRSVAKTTWAPLPAAIYGSDTSGEVTQQLNRGTSVLNNNFPHVDNSDWIVSDQIDATSLTNVLNHGFSRVIVPEADLTPQSRATTLERPFTISLGKNKANIPGGMADQGLANHFTDTGGPVLDAHQLLADLAVLWNDLPGSQRSVIVMPPLTWKPDPGFLETFFRGLDTSPVLKAETTDQFFSTPPEKVGSATLSRTLAPLPKAQYSNFPSSRLLDERKRVDGFANLVDPDNTTLDQIQQRLLLAERSELDDKTRTNTLDSIKAAVDHQLNLIQMPSERSIRLTARQGQIPISVENDTGYTVHVRVELTSNKLGFPNGDSRMIDLERQHVTEGFAVNARTTGAFPLQVRLLSPNGQTIIQHSTITIHSTATSAIGVGLSIGAGTFLIIWWIRSALKTRHKKRTAVQIKST